MRDCCPRVTQPLPQRHSASIADGIRKNINLRLAKSWRNVFVAEIIVMSLRSQKIAFGKIYEAKQRVFVSKNTLAFPRAGTELET